MPNIFVRTVRREKFPTKTKVTRPVGSAGSEKIIIRKSIFFIIAKLITIELIFDAFYLLIRIPPVYFHLPTEFEMILVPWYFVLFMILNGIKLILVIIIALKWVTSSYELKDREIHYKYGIFSHNEKVYLCELTQEVECSQGLFGRIFNFGSVEIYNPAIKERILLDAIPNPQKYAEIIKKNLSTTENVSYVTMQS